MASSATHPQHGPVVDLSPEVLATAAELNMFDENGAKVAFGSLFENQRAIVVFIRHFFCGHLNGHDYLTWGPHQPTVMPENLSKIPESALASASTSIIVIGCGEHSVPTAYRDITGFKGPIYADPSRALYHALGMTIESFERTPSGDPTPAYLSEKGFVMRTLESIGRALKRPALVGKQGRLSQLGGDFILGPGMQCTFASRMRHTEDHVPVDVLMKVAGITV